MKSAKQKPFIGTHLKNPEGLIIDVRSRDEYTHRHLPGSINIPLDELSHNAENLPQQGSIYVICQSGRRSAQACDLLQRMGYKNAASIEGGLAAIDKAGGYIVQGTRSIPIMRQVQIIAGFLILLGVLLSLLIHPAFLTLVSLVGAGLLFAGVSGFCGMAILLSRCPWNRAFLNQDKSSGQGCCEV